MSKNRRISARLAGVLLVACMLTASPAEAQKGRGQRTIFTSTCACVDCRPGGRWEVKTDATAPPPSNAIDAAHRVRPSQVVGWPLPEVKHWGRSPRSDRELEWFAVTGVLKSLRVEEDGDLHLELGDGPSARARDWLTVEVPLGRPWCAIR